MQKSSLCLEDTLLALDCCVHTHPAQFISLLLTQYTLDPKDSYLFEKPPTDVFRVFTQGVALVIIWFWYYLRPLFRNLTNLVTLLLT